MFSENEKISGRQLYRSIVVTLAGPTLLVCPRVAGEYGADGFLVYGVAGILSIIYIQFILFLRQRVGGNLFANGDSARRNGCQLVMKGTLNILLVGKLLLLAVGGLYLICDVVTGILLPETHVLMVLAVLAVALIYWNQGSVESSGRAFEILFYWVLVPIIIVVGMAIPKVSASNLVPPLNHDMRDIFLAGAFLWFIFTPAEILILCGSHYRSDRKTTRGVWRGVLVLFVGNIVTYATILGIYGAKGINEGSPYPLLKVMQISGIPGDFLRRVDGFMSVFLVLSLFCGMVMLMDYMGISIWEIGDMLFGNKEKHRKEKCKNVIDLKKRCATKAKELKRGNARKDKNGVVEALKGVGLSICHHKKIIFSCVVTLIMVVSVVIIRKNIPIKQPATGMSEAYADKKLISSVELEERAFVMSVIMREDSITLEIASDEKDMWRTKSRYVTLMCDTVEEAEKLYKESGDKRLDVTHMKAIFIEEKIYKEDIAKENLQYMYEQEKYAENILVCVMDKDIDKMAKLSIDGSDAFAVKIENIMENSGRSNQLELYRVYRAMLDE